MADYIERQAVYKKIAEMEETARSRYLDTPWDSHARVQLNERTALKHMIADEPAANVREDVHGAWLRENNREKSYIRVCSVCKKIAYCCTPVFFYKFCPNCGARMDGGGER